MVDRQNNSSRDRRNEVVHKPRRNKYISRACQDCQRRKVKCSGEDVCLHCRVRDIPCIYIPKSESDGRRKRGQAPEQSSNSESNEPVRPNTARRSSNQDNSNISVEDRISQLRAEVRRVSEAGLTDHQDQPLNKIPRTDRNRRFTFPSTAPYTIDLPQGPGQETDTFNVNASGSKNLSLSSQLATLQEMLRPLSTSPPSNTTEHTTDRVFPLELPRPSKVRYLLDAYFREMDSFFPYLDQKDTESRIFKALESLGYSEYDLIIDVDVQRHAIIALLCNMLVMGECMNSSENPSDDLRPGWPMYVRGRKLLQQCSSLKAADLDLVRYHTLSALYMMHSELLQPASHAISVAVQLAMAARLNDQGAWQNCSSDEIVFRQSLWWTIYFIDRRISQRNGSPYLIRDTEVAVDDFGQKSLSLNLDPELSNNRSTNQQLLVLSADASYLQVLVNFARVWGQVWDTFFAASAPKRRDWREVEITDTRILLVRRQLPSDLTWNTEMIGTYIANGETEPQLRRRLAIFIRINLLRMIIRQNPLLSSQGDEETRQFCALLAKHSIEAMAAFSSVTPGIAPSGYFISTALVECIYHLVYIFQDFNLPIDRAAIIESFQQAYQLLVEFARTLNSAKRAVRALTAAIFSEDGVSSLFDVAATSKYDQEGMDITPRNESLGSQANRSPSPGSSKQAVEHAMNFHPGPTSVLTPTLSLSFLSSKLATSDCNAEMYLDSNSHDQLRYSTDSGFMQDLANSYGDFDFDASQLLLDRL